jgi:hypothetical protein
MYFLSLHYIHEQRFAGGHGYIKYHPKAVHFSALTTILPSHRMGTSSG